MTTKTKTTATPAEPADARAELDHARSVVADWEQRLHAAQAALDAAEQASTAGLLDHPDDVETVVRDRAAARERVTVTADVLDRARAAEADAARVLALSLVPALRARYAQEAKDTQAKLDAFKARTAELIGLLVEHTADTRWEWALPTESTPTPQATLELDLVKARRSARIVDVFGAGNGPALVEAIQQRDASGLIGSGNVVGCRPARQELVQAILAGDIDTADALRADIARNGDGQGITSYPTAEFVTLDDIPAELR